MFSKHVLLIVIIAICTYGMHAEARHALIIGNDSYPGNALQNARNDAKGVDDSLRNAGYITTLVLDADLATLSRKVDDFVDTLHPGDTAVLYYAGHGLQVDGENFLVPVDFHLTSPDSARTQGYSLSSILERFTAHQATTQIVILDACRDNPFLGSRSYKGGWAGIGTSAGAFIAFGTSPGSTASDAPGEGHGLFTKSLLTYLTTSDLDIEEMFRKVREDVIRQSGGKQVPWVSSSLIGSFHVRPELDAKEPLLASVALDPSGGSSGPFSRGLRSESVGSVTDSNAQGQVQAAVSSQEGQQIAEAATLFRGEKFDAAISTLKNILLLDPACGVAWRLLGLVLHATGRDLEAVSTLGRALEVDRGDARAASYKCAIETVSNASSAVSDCSVVVGDQPSADGYVALGGALLSSGQADVAYLAATRAISLGGSDLAYALRGAIVSAQGHPELAGQDYSRAARLSIESRGK